MKTTPIEKRVAAVEKKVADLEEESIEVLERIGQALKASSEVIAAWKSHDQKFFYKEEDK